MQIYNTNTIPKINFVQPNISNFEDKTVTRLKLQNVKIQTIPIPIKLLGFMPKKGQDLGPNNIVEQYVHVCLGLHYFIKNPVKACSSGPKSLCF